MKSKETRIAGEEWSFDVVWLTMEYESRGLDDRDDGEASSCPRGLFEQIRPCLKTSRMSLKQRDSHLSHGWEKRADAHGM